jgi:hypothetical protein
MRAAIRITALGLLLAGCGDDESATRGRGGDGEGDGGASAGGASGTRSAPATSATAGDGDGDAPNASVTVTVAAAASSAAGPNGPSGGDPEGTCRSAVTGSAALDECLEAACCTEYNVCSNFGHDGGACAACLQAGGGQRCDSVIGCVNRSGCTLEHCSYPNGAPCFGDAPHEGAKCVDPLRVCDGVADCSTGSDEMGCDDAP